MSETHQNGFVVQLCATCGKRFASHEKQDYCCYKCEQLPPTPCKICSKAFIPTNALQKYCSSECKYKHDQVQYAPKREVVVLQCAFCHNDFETVIKKLKYCSPTCRLGDQKRKREQNWADTKKVSKRKHPWKTPFSLDDPK